jgi:transposase-like protein
VKSGKVGEAGVTNTKRKQTKKKKEERKEQKEDLIFYSKMPTRKTYTVEEKLSAVARAKKEGVSSVSKDLHINECLIRRWSKKKSFPANRLREEGGGRKPILSEELEKELHDWILEQRKNKIALTTALILAKMSSFKSRLANDSRLKRWPRKHNVYNFLKRWNLESKEDGDESEDEYSVGSDEDAIDYNCSTPDSPTSALSRVPESSLEKACIMFLLNPLPERM